MLIMQDVETFLICSQGYIRMETPETKPAPLGLPAKIIEQFRETFDNLTDQIQEKGLAKHLMFA